MDEKARRLHGGLGVNVKQHTILTPENVMEIRTKHIPHHKEYSFVAFARKFGVHPTTILEAYRGKSWRTV